MKKYLMTGIAALALCVGFTSCSHDIETYTEDELKDLNAQKVLKTYEDAFKATFGTPAANKDWGFTATRTRGSNDNKNQWGNPNHGNWQIPDPLTEGQSIRVKAYFQHHPNLTFNAPSYDTYFVQQVYKGYTDANTEFSNEYYFAADHTEEKPDTVIGSGHMDKLTVGLGATLTHVDNFNYGTYNHGDSLAVLNTGATDENNPTNYHMDMITLIEGVVPTAVGFHDSEGDVQHNDHAALVGWKTIDDWAEENKTALQASGEYGETIGSKWNRSFVGLDYESRVPEDIYLKNNGEKIYAKVRDCVQEKDYVWDGTRVWKWSEIADTELQTPDGRKFPLVDTDKNTYLGTYIQCKGDNQIKKIKLSDITASYSDVTEIYGDSNPNRETDAIDLSKIFDAIGTGAVAAVNNDKGGFVKNLGGRDYVFSDWIVTLSEALQIDTPPTPPTPTPDLRVIAEDLTVEANGDASDFDFNDVVFDVYYTTTNSAALVKVKAAGGTLPLRIAYKANPTSDEDYYEVHNLFAEANPGVNCAGKMINTNGTAETQSQNVRSRSLDNLEEPEAFPLEFTVSNAADAKNIIIEVDKGDGTGWVSLTAERGKAASKVAVGITFQWNDERQPMPESFKQYVTSNETTYDEWWRVNENEN